MASCVPVGPGGPRALFSGRAVAAARCLERPVSVGEIACGLGNQGLSVPGYRPLGVLALEGRLSLRDALYCVGFTTPFWVFWFAYAKAMRSACIPSGGPRGSLQCSADPTGSLMVLAII